MQHYRVIKVSMLGATNNKPTRIVIKENRGGITDRKVISFDHQYNSGKEQAIAYLKEIGINIVAEGYDDNFTYLMSDTWGSKYVNIKGEKPTI